MAEQDAQDIAQMNMASNDVPVVDRAPKKSYLLWVVLSCVVVGVGLGVYVYQKSLTPTSKVSPTPKATVIPTQKPGAVASPVSTPTTPGVNAVTPTANTITFPKAGKIRVYNTLNNIQLVMQLTINGVVDTITSPAVKLTTTQPVAYGDSTFSVTAGSTATFQAFLNSTSGPKLRGWIPPMDSNNHKECGVPGGSVANNESQIAYIKTLLAGEPIIQYQCWEDDDTPGEFNDVYMVWSYVPSTTNTSPSPSASATVSPSPSTTTTPTPSPSPSPSVKTTTTTTTPTPSPRAAMPDTSDGVPVTGIFEVTAGTVSVGVIFLLLGLVGLLAL